MTRIAYAMPIALLLSLCLACTDAKHKYDAKAVAADSSKMAGDTSTEAFGNAYEQSKPLHREQQAGEKKPDAPPAANPDWDKKIIKTADLSVEVKNFSLFTQRLHQAVKISGGYIAQEEQSQSASEITNTVTIKVPVANFDDLLLQLPGDSDRLVDKKISSQDVTMEVIDTKSRLETKKEVRERYLELLRQAHNMKDILAVQSEIDGIQQEMDQASGRISYLSHSAAYSTINIKFYQLLNPGAVENPSPSFFRQLRDSIADGWNGLSGFLIEALRAWPLWIALVLSVLWVRKTIRNSKTKTVTPKNN